MYRIYGMTIIWLSNDKKKDNVLKVRVVLNESTYLDKCLLHDHYRAISPHMTKEAPLVSIRELEDGGFMDFIDLKEDEFEKTVDWDNQKIIRSEQHGNIYLCETLPEWINLIEYIKKTYL